MIKHLNGPIEFVSKGAHKAKKRASCGCPPPKELNERITEVADQAFHRRISTAPSSVSGGRYAIRRRRGGIPAPIDEHLNAQHRVAKLLGSIVVALDRS